MTDYIWDVFISYKRDKPAGDWVRNYFYNELENWLPQYLPSEYRLKIFIDKDIKTGQNWSERLKMH